MNFKPSKLKVLFSIIAFAAVDLFLASKVVCLDNIPDFNLACPPWYSYALGSAFWGMGLIAAIVVYLAWSLVEKKK